MHILVQKLPRRTQFDPKIFHDVNKETFMHNFENDAQSKKMVNAIFAWDSFQRSKKKLNYV